MFVRTLMILALALAAGCSADRTPQFQGEMLRTEPWSGRLLATMATLPVMSDGRVMPLSTLASFTLYAVHGRRDVLFKAPGADGRNRTYKLDPTSWLLDVWCHPRQAAHYPLFRIENVGVLDALGFEHQGQKQGFEYLTYAQLLGQGEKLQQLASKYRPIPQERRSEVEEHLVQLFRQLLSYHRLHRLVEAFQFDFPLRGEALRAAFGGRERIRLAELLRDAEVFRTYVRGVGENFDDEPHGNLGELLSYLKAASESDGDAMLVPPVVSPREKERWLALGEIVDSAVRGRIAPAHVDMLEHLQAALLAEDEAQREREFIAFHGAVTAAARARGELGTVELESHYYSANWHFHAMMTFVLGFLVAVVGWILPRSRLLWGGSMLISSAALAMLVADVWLRCLITGYGPIQRLYDTFLFIAGSAALLLLIAEWAMPRRIALALAPLFGALLILCARLFEVADARDTMQPLPAVLLSNFWLAVHVPTINIGYAAALAAAMVANAWIVLRVCRLAAPSEALPKSLVRSAYGITCFSLATSVVGTILGGVWANDSWGRFWGWDPKENGALLICLSQIALLHARMSGMVRDTGFVMWTAATGMVVVFSWFHTNLLQVGLHSYGFSAGLRDAVWWSYVGQFAVLGIGAVDVWLRPAPAPVARPRGSATAPAPTT